MKFINIFFFIFYFIGSSINRLKHVSQKCSLKFNIFTLSIITSIHNNNVIFWRLHDVSLIWFFKTRLESTKLMINSSSDFICNSFIMKI